MRLRSGTGITMGGGTGLGVRAPEPGCAKMSLSSSGGSAGAGGPISKLTEEEEEGFERDMERRALGGREVAGRERRAVEVGGLDVSVDEE